MHTRLDDTCSEGGDKEKRRAAAAREKEKEEKKETHSLGSEQYKIG